LLSSFTKRERRGAEADVHSKTATIARAKPFPFSYSRRLRRVLEGQNWASVEGQQPLLRTPSA